MKFISWNVNGIRACKQKGFDDFFKDANADFFSIQETKCQDGQIDLNVNGYFVYMNSAIKKGYSGTAIFAKHKPLNVFYGIGSEGKYNDEGRVITLEYDNFYLVNAYVPNAQEELKRLDFRMQYEDDLKNYLLSLNKPVIYCGDLNVAHERIDIKNPDSNTKNPGFSIEERTKFSELLSAGFKDTFRTLYPDTVKYSWWSYRFNARANNAGWRIDYFVVSDSIMDKVIDAKIHNEIFGSDHCPVELDINI
ncbi:MAG: exodeoxyribonuclease III [Acholeplasmatales bacterium]|nr:exodeoxyribonuclease III [Acholeplasmatales bacterium]